MSKINTNLSASPYWDDYDENKQFYKLLFKPKLAVQVREVNQLQTLTQAQISRHADHIFKDGSIVSGCNIIYDSGLKFIRVSNTYNIDNANNVFSEDELRNFLVYSPSTGLRAVIVKVTQGFAATYPDTNTLFVKYLNTGSDVGGNKVTEFSAGETLEIYNDTQDKLGAINPGLLYNTIDILTFVDPNQSATGPSYSVTVGDGVVYQKGYFVKVLSHTVIVRKYDQELNDMLVGFETQEEIVNYLQDPTLIDPADTSNRNGIGADRLKLVPVLVAKHRSEIGSNDDFFPIIEFGLNSRPVKQNVDPEYAKLGDYMAGEQYETHGDFYIKPFIVGTRASANTENFIYTIDSGTAYIKGNRVDLLNTINLETNRATDLGFYNGNITTINYGNYVLIEEVLGTFNADKLVTVDIYDAPQTAVTSSRNPNSPTGTKIGVANVRAVIYNSGNKGGPKSQYKIYISNILINPGKSFVNDAKSFCISATDNGLSYGAAADIILVNGKARINDSGLSNLIFDTGIQGIRRFRDPSGVNDTSFTFRDIATATLQANGSVTFSLNTPHAGGAERFFVSPGVLSNVNKLRIDISATSNLQGDNLPGTVNGNSGNTTVVGTGTTFTSHFTAGEIIRIGSTNYTVQDVANNTHLTVNANVTGGGATANYSKAWNAGTIFDLTNAVVTAVSNTQFTVSLGSAITVGAPQTLIASYPVLRTEAYETKKDVKKDTFVRIDCANNSGGIAGPYNLGIVDVYEVTGIYVGDTYSENNPNRIGWFSVDNGQSPTHYDHAKLILKSEYQGRLSANSKILVKLNHFVANNTTGIGFFSVDSYPVRSPGETANTTNISYDDIPGNLRSVIDFRPQKFNTAATTNDPNAGTINPATSNTSFNITSAGSYLAEPDANLQADIEYYRPRIDVIQVNKEGVFSVKQSNPSDKPITPNPDNDASVIAVSYVPAYPGITNDQVIRDPANKPKIKTTLVGNRVYTMRDINALDKRITTLEYYMALSMLEQQAKDYVVKDENGLDRFKNGIFADPLKNHFLGDVSNFEYNIAIDERYEYARPPFEKTSIDLDVITTNGIKVAGRTATLDYTSERFITQPYATKFRNVTESVWRWNGKIDLYPEYDHYKNETSLPAVNVEIDLASPWEEFANSPFGQQFGEWRTDANVLARNTTRSTSRGSNSTTTTTTTEFTDSRDVLALNVGTSQTTYDLGSYVTDVTLNPYMRSRQIAFIAHGLKPNTRVYPFFADEPVSDYCAPGQINPGIYNQSTGELIIDSGKEDQIVNRNSDFGAPLITDDNGFVSGIFVIPADRFRVGDRQFILTDVDNLVTGRDAILTSAGAVYTASALTTNTKDLSITTINPTIDTNAYVESQTRVETSTTVTRRVTERERRGGGDGKDGRSDPLGQTFLASTVGSDPGVFLESIEVFFRSKDPNLGITCRVVEMQAGVPDTSRHLGASYLLPAAIALSDDSSVGTTFKFNEPIYLTRDKYYAFFLQPDGDSPEYTIWLAEIGAEDIITGQKIFSNPYVGTATKSSNSESWDIIQTEDIKFNANICRFVDSGEIILSEQDDDYFTVEGFAFANTSTTIRTGDVVYSADANNIPITANSSPFGLIQEYDQIKDTLIIDSSTGGFAPNTIIHIYRPPEPNNPASISPDNLIATSRILQVEDAEYSVIVPRISTTTPTGTNVTYSYKGMDTAGIYDSSYMPMQAEVELEMIDKVRVVKSKSNRIGNAKSAEMKLNLSTNSAYVSPIVNLRRRSMFVIDNIVNNDLTDEHTRNGKALVRYISRAITLAEGQDAEDIRIIVSGYRPSGTNIDVYAKILCADDSDNFLDKYWTKLDLIEGAAVFSSSADVTDYREYVYTFPTEEEMQGTAYKNTDNLGIVEYKNASGTIFVGYKTYALKVIIRTENKQLVPRLDDIMGINLQI